MKGKPAKYQRTGIAVVGALVVLVIVLGWRAASLVGPQTNNTSSASSSAVTSNQEFLVYRTYTVLHRGKSDSLNDDTVEYDFMRYPIGGAGVAERLAKEVDVGTGSGAGAPWMTQISPTLLLFSRQKTGGGGPQGSWIDVSGEQENVPGSNSTILWNGLPSPDGSTIVYTDRDKKAVSVLTKTDGLTRSFSTADLVDTGYLSPYAWDPDGRTVYLKAASEGESFAAGLWELDVATGKITEVPIVRKLGLSDYTLSPSTHLLAGSTFTCDSLDQCGVGPSSLYVVDLSSGKATKVLSNQQIAYSRPLISPDGKKIVYTLNGDSSTVRMVDPSDPSSDHRVISGNALAWTPDGGRLVLNRDNELQLFDVATGAVTTVVRRTGTYQDPDFRGVDFIGIVEKR